MQLETCVPPGFRFHPTEEELIGYYLNRKINSLKIDLDVITDIDLYKMEPWDIEGRCKLGYEEQNEWYFFSHKDRKYPTGTRTNRATTAGFWKATGRDKAILSKERIIGMRKTLVFYKGRAPNGRKTDWIMHEYRIQTSEHGPPQEEGWVVCRAFKKPNPSNKQGFEGWNNAYYSIRNNNNNNNDNNINNNNNNSNNMYKPPMISSYPSTPNLMHNFDPALNQVTNYHHQQQPQFPNKSCHVPFQNMVDIQKLESPSISTSFVTNDNSFDHGGVLAGNNKYEEVFDDIDQKGNFGSQFYDWKSFDKLISSSSSQGMGSTSSSSNYGYPNMGLVHNNDHEGLDAQNHFSYVLECFPDGL